MNISRDNYLPSCKKYGAKTLFTGKSMRNMLRLNYGVGFYSRKGNDRKLLCLLENYLMTGALGRNPRHQTGEYLGEI